MIRDGVKGVVLWMGQGALAGGVSIQCARSGRYMTACHIAEVEVRSLLVQTVTPGAEPKTFPDVCQQRYWSCIHVRLVVEGGWRNRQPWWGRGVSLARKSNEERRRKREQEEEQERLCVCTCGCWWKMETETLKCFRFLPSELLPRRESLTFIYSAPQCVSAPTIWHQSHPFIFLMLILYHHFAFWFVITGDK